MTVETKEIRQLLDFERCELGSSLDTSGENPSVSVWKDRGDQLLRLGDATSATSYYEMALGRSSAVSIGSTIIVQRGGFPKVAEVDCLEDDSVDITIVDSGEEAVIRPSDILLGILDRDHEKFQERILLNLARCMLQLSDIDTINRPKYLKSAILACSLTITVSHFHDSESANNTNYLSGNTQTALHLRAKAQSGLSKWPNAIADAKRLIKAGNKQGSQLLEALQRNKLRQVKKDKKLSKAVAKWVQTATSESVSEKEKNDQFTLESSSSPRPNVEEETVSQTNPPLVSSSFLIVLSLIAAYLIQKMLNGY